MEAACPKLRFHAQVCMAALVEPDMDRNNRSAYYSTRGKVAQASAGYKTIRWNSKSKPSVEKIREELQA